MTHSSLARFAIASLLAVLPAAIAAQGRPVRIGIARTFLVDQPKGVVDIATDDFRNIVKRTIDLDNEIHSKSDYAEFARQLDAKKVDFGILHGHEYAWIKAKYPELKPLVITESKQPFRAYVIIHKNNFVKSIADLRGKTLDMPTGTKETCRMYLAKQCAGQDVKSFDKFFGNIVKSESPADALDNVARGKVQAALIDAANLEFYKKERGPVYEKNLRVLAESEQFPPAVILYKPGAVDPATVEKFKDGLLKAHNSPDGRDMMKAWNIEGFEAVSKDYDKQLAEVLKAYPAP